MSNQSVTRWPRGQVTVYKPEKCYNGYTLIPYERRGAAIIDMKGRVVHSWKTRFLEKIANGNYMSLRGGITEIDWDDNPLWSYQGRVHHDAQRLKNGSFIGLSSKKVNAPKISKVELTTDGVIEVNPNKEVVWEWWSHEHFDELGLTEKAKKIIYEYGGGEVGTFPRRPEAFVGDWFHQNTVQSLPENELYKQGDTRFRPGNLLMSSRNLNLIFIVDKKTGEIIWKFGPCPHMHEKWNGFWITGRDDNTRKCLVGQHDPKMLHNGNILIFDNGGGGGYPAIVRFHSRLVEINPATGEVVWEYAQSPVIPAGGNKWLSVTTGGAWRLPNGNTISLDSNLGRMFEVTPQGETVWEFISGAFYRTQRISYEDCPKADPSFMKTDGHLDVKPEKIQIPENLGLPVKDGPDYCPRYYD